MLLGLLAFLSIGVALVAPMPWLLGLHDGMTEAPPLLAHLLGRYTVQQLVFVLHVAGGGLALAAGPWQLMPGLRARRPRLHRATGLVYVGAVAVAGSAGLMMGPFAWGGTSARLGFTALALVWLGTTALGAHRIALGDRIGHAVWMQRSFALAFAAVSLRIQFPLLAALGVANDVAYAVVAWSSWVPNLVVVHLALQRRRRLRRP